MGRMLFIHAHGVSPPLPSLHEGHTVFDFYSARLQLRPYREAVDGYVSVFGRGIVVVGEGQAHGVEADSDRNGDGVPVQ